jgi:hypothetical protein
LTGQPHEPHHQCVPSTSLTITPAQSGVLAKMDSHFAAARKVMAAALMAPSIDGTERHEEMTPEEERIARHALEPQKSAPVYLQMAKGLVELEAKLVAGLGDEAAPKLVHHMVHLVQARQYERVDVSEPIDVEVVEKK